MPNHPTPADPVAAKAVESARRVALNSLEDYRVVDEKHYWEIGGTVVGLVFSNIAVWIYVLLRLPH